MLPPWQAVDPMTSHPLPQGSDVEMVQLQEPAQILPIPPFLPPFFRVRASISLFSQFILYLKSRKYPNR